ncbi:MAG: sigma-54 dependent transcriptional regulator [Smithellaceae bacterium]
MAARILIVDDDSMFCEMLSHKVQKMGHAAFCASTLGDAFSLARSQPFDVVYLDVNMPDGSGLDAIARLRACVSEPEIIIMTGDAGADGAELAIKSGAWDYVAKPSSISHLMLPLERSLQYREARKLISSPQVFKREGIVGSSQTMRFCLDQTARASVSDANILITGETGTGKELIAWAVHNNSARADKNFVVVDCAALSATLVESTLFGYEKGAYTGADKTQEGLIKQADGGTLFLDEIGELPLLVQKSFLRVLQERRFRPLGGKSEVASDFRLVAATNRNLDAMVADGEFRNDLLFRIRSFHIETPALIKRQEDIVELTEFYIAKLCARKEIPPKTLSPEFMDCLCHYNWPGNVRELFNTLERVMVEAGLSPVLFSKHLPIELRVKVAAASFVQEETARVCIEDHGSENGIRKFHDVRDLAVAKIEYDYMRQLIGACGRDVKQACDVSGLSRSRFYELLKKYGLKV